MLSPEEGGGDAFEPNDDLAHATQAPDWPRAGVLCAGDREVQVVPVRAGERITIRLMRYRDQTVDFSDVEMRLSDGSRRVASSSGDASGKQVSLVGLQTGAFILEVFGSDGTPRPYVLEREVS